MFLIERRERKKHRIGARFCKLEYGQSLILTCCVVSNDSNNDSIQYFSLNVNVFLIKY